MIAGAILRVEVFTGQRSFELIAGLVLLPLGLWLLLGAQTLAHPRPAPTRGDRQATWLLALVVGTIGGLYGIGGGSILAPILIALGYSVYEVAPASLAATFLTSAAGIGTYQVLQVLHGGNIAPQWILGAWLGAGGFAGSYCGARLQTHLPERNLRRLLGTIACLVAARYLQTALQTAAPSRSAPHTRSALEPFAGSARRAVRAGMLDLVGSSMSGSATTSGTANRPPGLSTRAASVSTLRLSPARLITSRTARRRELPSRVARSE